MRLPRVLVCLASTTKSVTTFCWCKRCDTSVNFGIGYAVPITGIQRNVTVWRSCSLRCRRRVTGSRGTGQRVKDFMNYYVTEVMEEYDPDMDQMLFYLPLAGSTFKKFTMTSPDDALFPSLYRPKTCCELLSHGYSHCRTIHMFLRCQRTTS